MSSFTCRRAAACDVSAVRSLIEQQRLAGVRYSDPPQSSSDVSQRSSSSASTHSSNASTSSSSSLFAARSASNAVHLRSAWGDAELAELLASQWLTAVVSDGDDVICCACFHTQPNQLSLDGVNHSSNGSSGGRQARDWPTWLPLSLQCVSPSSSLVSSFHPSACRFLTYFACCTVSNTKAERALLDCLLRFVFECDSAVSQLLALRPHTDPLSPVDGTPLSSCFKPLEEPSASLTATARPASAAPAAPMLSCWRVLRSSLWPALTVRRGRLEDHDDLVPLFAQLQPASLSASAFSSVPPFSVPARSSALSPLSLLSSTSCVSLVAECGGRAVGLLCLSVDVDVARLSRHFDVEHMSWLSANNTQHTKASPHQPLAESHGGADELEDDWSELTRLPSSVVRHLLLCYNALLAAGGLCNLSPASRSPSVSVDAGEQQRQHLTTGGLEWHTLLALLSTTSLEALQRHTKHAQTAVDVASVIAGWSGDASSADGGSAVSLLATDSDFVRLCHDCITLLHSRSNHSALLPSLVGHWLDCLDSKLPPAAMQQLHAQQQRQHVDGREEREVGEAAVDGAGHSAAFAVSCFVLSDEHSQQAEQFILAAFAVLPQRHWMLLSAPYDAPHGALMTHMSQLQPRAGLQHQATQAVYALHRHTAVSALSPPEATVTVRAAEQSDLSALTKLVKAQAAAEYGLQLSVAATDASSSSSHVAHLSSLAAASSAVRLELQRVRRSLQAGSAACLVVSCAGEIVGLVRLQRLQSTQQFHALQAHYQCASTQSAAMGADSAQAGESAAAESSYERHLFIRSFVLHPLFACHSRFVLLEAMRLSGACELLYTVSGRQLTGGLRPTGSFNAALLRCMQQRAPVLVPAAALPQHSKHDSLHLPAAGATSGGAHITAGLAVADEAASGTERVSRGGHEDDAAATPGPPLSLSHLHASQAAGSEQHLHSHRQSLSAGSGAAGVGCPACLSLACPHFALHSVTAPLLSVPRLLVSQRVVFVGASATNLSALSALLTTPSAVYFTSLTLISLQPLPALLSRDSLHLAAAVSAVPSSDFELDAAMLQRLCLDARVQLVTGSVVDVDAARQLVTVRGTAADGHTQLVPYDQLILATGKQPTTRHLNQQLVSSQSPPARADGGSGGIRQAVEAATPSSGALSQSQLGQQTPQPSLSHHCALAATVSHTPLPSTESSSVSGVWPLSSLEHAVTFLSSWLSASPAAPPAIVVQGASLSALTVLCSLLALGVPGDCITWVHAHSNLSHVAAPASSTAGAATEALSLSVAVLGEELPLMPAVLNTLAEERIRIVQRCELTGLHVRASHEDTSVVTSLAPHSSDSDPTQPDSQSTRNAHSTAALPARSAAAFPSPPCRVLQSVVLSSGDVLPCSVLLLCEAAEVDGGLLDVAVRRLGLVHDGRFVVDRHFRSASLPNIRLAGPMAKFQRGLLPQAVEAAAVAGSTQAAQLGVQLLDHSFYSSVGVGRALAEEIGGAVSQRQPEQRSAALLSSLHGPSCVRRAVLPGPVAYFHAWSAAYCLHPSASVERVLTQSFSSYSFSLHVCTATLRIVRVRYWGVFDLPAAANLSRLIGLPISYCNRLLWRWESNQIRSLLLFLQQDWAQLLYCHAFSSFRRQLVAQLDQQYNGQLTPIFDKLLAFQRAVHVDQQRRHEQQQLHSQRRSSNIRAALLQPNQSASSANSGMDGSALHALNTYLPAQFKDVAHRAVLTFIASHAHSLPKALQLPVSLHHVK